MVNVDFECVWWWRQSLWLVVRRNNPIGP